MADGQLQAARDRVRRLHQAGRLREAVLGQLADVDRELTELERRYEAEERDVASLERRSFAAIVAEVLGNRDEKLAEERAGAEAARLRLDGHRARRQHLAGELAMLDRELAGLADTPQRYETALAEAERSLRAAGDPRGVQLSQLAVELADVRADLREHEEAYHAGRIALDGLNSVLHELGGARNWSAADMVSGTLADWVEHDRLVRAHHGAWYTQQALDRFAREMADLGAQINPRLPEIDTRWFADWFFDSIIVDAMKHQRIARTQEQVADLVRWLHATLEELRHNQVALTRRRAELRARREALHGLV